MERKFKITIGEKTFIVKVEEITETKPTISEAQSIAVRQSTTDIRHLPTPTSDEKGILTAPMPGVILAIKCQVGDEVKAGDILLTLEAMKMENEIYAPKSGVIKRIVVSEKQSVKYGDILLEII